MKTKIRHRQNTFKI